MLRVFGKQKLQRYALVERDVPSFDDVPHTALSEHALDTVFVRKQGALRDDRRRRIIGRCGRGHGGWAKIARQYASLQERFLA
jgi:hypothetical protein